ncbi:uncharacterized protein PFL1_01371 [Pseudozyma flocculosa PF-1]|uniref:uncharacterized protein n=1 Tax=Pseudozyma flocculosa PF-1 TaxID=1277687 RepID=UPI0004561417|nr:uncharacterized protein PFL1_01371 [Pseudozyma flocculosa PF-1]EPQ31183.1 hypothetical protein PFL1_01371 [Pseudozyma flocculosa PF-1]
MSSNPYFEPMPSLGGAANSAATSASVSPAASGLLSPSSCSTAVSKLSLSFDDSASRSPSTSACTSISDASSEIPSIGGHPSKSVSPGAVEAAADDELDALEVERREQEELDSALLFGTQIVQREARALAMAAKRLSRLGPQMDGFREAVKLVLRATNGERGGKVVLTGVGKSGIIAKKLSATFLSLGTPSVFLHPVEALHGDLGLLTPHRDVVLALSHSGSSPELLALVPHLNARKCPIVALVGKRESPLVKASDAWIDCGTGKDDDSDDEHEDGDDDDDDDDDNNGSGDDRGDVDVGAPALLERSMSEGESSASSSGISTPSEADSVTSAPVLPCSCSQRRFGGSRKRRSTRMARPSTDEAWDEVPAPSSSTTVALAMGDALAFSITRAKGLGRDMFAFNHPGGKLGADFRMQGHAVPLQTFDVVANGGGSAVATPIAN